MAENEKTIDKETIILLKVLDAIKDLMAITESVLDDPTPPRKRILKRKLSIMKERLPRTAGEVKTVVKRKDNKQLNFSNIKERTKVTY
jgi:hypothetical protein